MVINIYNLPPKKRLLWGLIFSALLSFITGLILFTIPSISVLEWQLTDFWARQEYGHDMSSDVAVIGIDEAFLDKYSWPLEKDLYADLIDYLSEMGAKVIAIDILFADNLASCNKSDSLFRELIGFTPEVVLAYGAQFGRPSHLSLLSRTAKIPSRFAFASGKVDNFNITGAVLPYYDLLAKSPHLGFINLAKPFYDGIDRKIPLLLSQDNLLFPSLSLCAASLFKQEQIDIIVGKKASTSNPKTLPIDKDGYLYIDFSDSIPVYQMSDVRESHAEWLLGHTPSIGKKQLQNRIIFIGNTALSLGDFGITPISVRENYGRTPNVLMHARAASTIIRNTGLHVPGRFVSILFTLGLVIMIILLFYFFPPQIASVTTILLFTLCFLVNRTLYLNSWFFPVLESVSTGILAGISSITVVFFEKEIDRKFLFDTFRTYLSPELIDEMHAEKIKPALGGEMVYATAFFSDIENFSTFSEALSPVDLITNLNEYFSSMTHILLQNHGTLDKFIGDAIVAFFGAPKPTHSHAYNACLAAVRMQEALADLREKWRATPEIIDLLKNIKMRIGINTGQFVTGNIGCTMRMNYTMLGDTVNLASRFEASGKLYGVYTIVGEKTYHHVKHDFHFRCLDKVRVKGRAEPVLIYQLMGIKRPGDDLLVELINAYDKAFQKYCEGDFSDAYKMFQTSLTLERFPHEKNPSLVMSERCRALLQAKPLNWDGVYSILEK